MEKLRRELEASQHLVTSLRAELEISGAQTQVYVMLACNKLLQILKINTILLKRFALFKVL